MVAFSSLDRRLGEWSHFIHGSGGHFNLATEVTVTDVYGNEYVLAEDTPIYMDHHFGDLAMAMQNDPHSVVEVVDHGHVTLVEYGEHAHEAELRANS